MMDYGSRVKAPYILPHPVKRREYVAEMRPGVIIGFSNYGCFKRGWGWAGDMLVRFDDGSTVWTEAYREQAA